MSYLLFLVAAPVLLAQGTVEGIVLNSVTRTPIPGATVELHVGSSKELAIRTATGTSGAFRFTDLPPGQYTPAFDADRFYASKGESLRITAAGESLHVEGELDPITTLSGRVLDPDGKPLPGFRVEAHSRQMSISLVTDPEGRFQLAELPPAPYLLVARPNRGTKLPAQVKQAPPTKDKTVWFPTYYPGVTDAAQALPIRAAGGELTGYDIHLRSVPVYRIRGTLRDERGNPAPGVPMTLRPQELRESMSNPEAETKTGAGGAFEFADIGPGAWRIAAETKRDGVDLDGFTVIAVSRHDEEDVQVRLAAPFSLEGSVQPEARLKGIYLTAVDGPGRRDAYADVSPDGRFQLKRMYPGRNKVNPSSDAVGYLAEVRLGDSDVTGQPLDLSPGAPPLRLVYRWDTGSLRGSVENGARATVVLFPYGSGDFPRTVRCTADGKFSLEGVRPGDYSVLAFNRVEDDQLDDAATVQRVTRGAVSVRVEPYRTASVDLKLTVWAQ